MPTLEPLEVVFHMDGTGVVYYPFEPILLDGLLAYMTLEERGRLTDLDAEDEPVDADLPLAVDERDGSWFWRASALMPYELSHEGFQMARRKVTMDRVELTRGTVNMQIGQTKSYDRPWPLLITAVLRGYCVGDPDAVISLCRRVRHIGAERGRGKGRVVSVAVRPVEADFSVVKNCRAMRYVPAAEGLRVVRPRPPYWHPRGAVRCLAFGEML